MRPAKLAGAPRFHQRDEIVVDFALQFFQAVHVIWIFRQERIEHRLVFARRIEPPFDAKLGDQLIEAERAADDPNRPNDRMLIGHNFVRRAGDHVAA